MTKKIIAALAAEITAMFCLTCMTSYAVYVDGSFEYASEGGEITITGYTGSDETVIVPAMIAGEPVSIIASGVFPDGCGVRTVYLPDTIVYTAEDAFGSSVEAVFSSETVLVQPTSAIQDVIPEATEPPDSGEASISWGGSEGEDIPEAAVGTSVSGTAPAVTEKITETASSETAAVMVTALTASAEKEKEEQTEHKTFPAAALVIIAGAAVSVLFVIRKKAK